MLLQFYNIRGIFTAETFSKRYLLRKERSIPVFLLEGNADFIIVRIFLVAPPDSAGFWVIPDVATVHVQLKPLVQRHIRIETHPRFAEVQARSIINNNLIFVVICKYNRNSKRGSSMSS